MLREDHVRLQHIAEACGTIRRFVSGRTREDLDSDEMLRLALTRAIEIIGEAASRVSDIGRRELPELPWSRMIGMRNRLIHAYFNVNLDFVWATATEEVPALASAVATALER